MKPMEPAPPGWPDNLTQAPPPPAPAPPAPEPEPEYEPKHLKQDEPANEPTVLAPIEPIPEPAPPTQPQPIPEPLPQPQPQPVNGNGYGTTNDPVLATTAWLTAIWESMEAFRKESTRRYRRSVAIALTYFAVTLVALIILLVNKASS